MALTQVASGLIASVSGASLTGTQTIPRGTLPTGSVLQVVTANSSSATSTTGGSYVASTVTASITPSSATSKIYIITSWWQSVGANNVTVACTLYRNSTDLGNPSYGFTAQFLPSTSGETTGVINYLDSPATTSSTTYTIYFKRVDSAGTVFVGNGSRTSVITLMEISA